MMQKKFYEDKSKEQFDRNIGFAENGVVFEDILTAYIGEKVVIKEGVCIGPCVTINGETTIESGCYIGQGCIITDSTIGKDTRIEQNSRLIKATIGETTTVLMSVITESSIGSGTVVGPFSYVRPGSNINNNVKIGDFVEIKNSNIGDGTKISHLTYVGDSDLGEDINLGCGVVFVNYDGKNKYRSTIEDGAFIGCNVNLVSPVNVGENAYIAAGTTVTTDVPAGSLSVARAKQRNLEGWVKKRGLLKERKDK